MSLLEKLKDLFGFTPAERPSAPPMNEPKERSEPVPVTSNPTSSGPPPAAQRREQLIHFMVNKLRAYQNEPEAAPVGLRLAIVCATPEEEEVYRVALWETQPGKFQKELNRQLANNYVDLPKDWRFDYAFFVDKLPDSTYQEGNLCLTMLDKAKPDGDPVRAKVVALVGQTEQAEYVLDPAQQTTFSIGRGHTSQTPSGRVRTNDIVILNEDNPGFDLEKGSGNQAVSRAHATIRYDMAQQRYVLLVDSGGLPASGNKTKILHPDEHIERADIAGMVYPLQHGDQIELGGAVTLQFTLL